jgi:hypothetical protein
MSLLKPKKPEAVRIFFRAPKELGERLKAVEDAAAKAGIPVSLDDDLTAALTKFLNRAEVDLGINSGKHSKL